MKTCYYVVLGLLALGLLSPHTGFGPLQELKPEDEAMLCGAGLFSNLECVSGDVSCDNGDVINGPCGPLGIDGVQCNTPRTDESCTSTWTYGGYDACSVTANVGCPTGVILDCRNVGGSLKWVNKGVGNASCGLYKTCF